MMNNNSSSRKQQSSGQIVLIVLLTMVVGLTMAMGVFLNSLSDVQITTTEDQSERAYTAAEAGIEDLMRLDVANLSTIADNNFGNTTLTVSPGLETKMTVQKDNNKFKSRVPQNDVATIQLEGRTANSVKIFWSDRKIPDQWTSNCDVNNGKIPAAIVVSILDNTGAVRYLAVDSTSCHPANNVDSSGFIGSSGNDTVEGELYGSSTTINLAAADILLRVRPIYNEATIFVQGEGGSLPTQQVTIKSTATVTDSNESRAISVTKSIASLPSIFDYVLFSGNKIVKD